VSGRPTFVRYDNRFDLDAASISSNNSNEIANDFLDQQQLPSPVTSTGTGTGTSAPDLLENFHNYSISTEINDSGREMH
jgi:hypothetical protein